MRILIRGGSTLERQRKKHPGRPATRSQGGGGEGGVMTSAWSTGGGGGNRFQDFFVPAERR